MAGDAVQFKLEGAELLQRRFDQVDRGVKNGLRREVRAAGKPIAALGKELALSSIGHMPRSPKWARMKIGIDRGSLTGIYMVPATKRSSGHPGYTRPNLAPLLLHKAMEPARDAMAPVLLERMKVMVDEETHRFG